MSLIWEDREVNDQLTEISTDVLKMGRETGWAWPPLVDFYADLKKITDERIFRSSYRGLRKVEK